MKRRILDKNEKDKINSKINQRESFSQTHLKKQKKTINNILYQKSCLPFRSERN